MSVFVVLNKVSANRSCRVTQSQFQVSALLLMQPGEIVTWAVWSVSEREGEVM